VSVIYRFASGSDGRDPTADRGCCGTVFELTPCGKKFTERVLHAFQGGADGAEPYGGVIIDRKGDLLGPTNLGGSSGSGTIFKLCCVPFPK
jgi:hypothetical protein